MITLRTTLNYKKGYRFVCRFFFDVLLTRFAFFSSQFNSNQFNVRDVIRGSDGTYIATTKRDNHHAKYSGSALKTFVKYFGIMLCVVQKHGFCCKHPRIRNLFFKSFFKQKSRMRGNKRKQQCWFDVSDCDIV